MTLGRALGRLSRHGQLKAAAAAMAVFLWVLVRFEAPAQDTFTIPVRVQVTDPAWTTLGTPEPMEVDVRLSGPVGELSRLRWGGTTIVVPVADGENGDAVVALREAFLAVQGYQGLHVEDFSPALVRVHLDRVATRTLPVRVRSFGELPRSLALTRAVEVAPQVVKVSGPQSIVSLLDTLDVVSVDLGETTMDGVLTTSIDTTGLAGLSIVPFRVTVRVPVEDAVQRIISSVPVLTEPSPWPGQLVVEPAAVDVEVSGARSQVNAMDVAALQAAVPLSAVQGMRPGEVRWVPVVIRGLPAIMSVRSTVDSVMVRRQVEP